MIPNVKSRMVGLNLNETEYSKIRRITNRCTGAELRRAFALLINTFSRPGYLNRYSRRCPINSHIFREPAKTTVRWGSDQVFLTLDFCRGMACAENSCGEGFCSGLGIEGFSTSTFPAILRPARQTA